MGMMQGCLILFTCLYAVSSTPLHDSLPSPVPLNEEMEFEDLRTIDEIILEARGGDIPMNDSAALVIRQEGPQNDSVLVEYDMLMTPEQHEMYKRDGLSKRKAIESERYRWPKKTVPYEIDPRGQFSTRDVGEIEKAFGDYHRWTCIKFQKRRNERNYIKIVHGGGCSSYVGVINYGAQPVTLGWGCRIRRIVAHELGHAIGFQHEQCRGDRDNYLRIHFENINSAMRYNFNKYGHTQANAFGIPYDYGSVMHYGKKFFSQNGRITMETLDKSVQETIGTAPTLSFADLKLANYIYKCDENCPKKKCPKGAYMDKNCNCICKGPSPSEPVKECKCKRRK